MQMNPFWKELGIAVVIGLVLPGVVLHLVTAHTPETQEEITQLVSPTETEATVSATAAPEPAHSVLVRQESGEVTEQNLEEYLVGVLLGEMPVSFEREALKAQAVVARTYSVKAGTNGGKHGDGSICTRSVCCQCYVSPEAYIENGGTEEGIDKVRQCIAETAGLVLTYEGSLIEATYFSCSGGRTEDAVAVWGSDFPYLQATDSPGEEKAAHYADSCSFSPSEFASKLGIAVPESQSGWIGVPVYTEGGGISEITIGGKPFSGTELRKLLNLPSTAITIQSGNGEILIHTRGYGHRVGMSQYGAEAMAVAGSTYEDILRHYYRGVSLEKLPLGEN